MSATWNPWHGCVKYSEGCLNCYVYRGDAKRGRDASEARLTRDYLLPLRRRRDGSPVIASGETVWTCFTSDFLLDRADAWRPDAWRAMRGRPDLDFFFITKRITRLAEMLPPDWGEGYPNVRVGCTCESQRRADERLPVFLAAPLAERSVICEPLLERVDISAYLGAGVARVVAGGESGDGARICDYDWVLSLRDQCAAAGVPFVFKQTGANFRKNGRVYSVPRHFQHSQAKKANISTGGSIG